MVALTRHWGMTDTSTTLGVPSVITSSGLRSMISSKQSVCSTRIRNARTLLRTVCNSTTPLSGVMARPISVKNEFSTPLVSRCSSSTTVAPTSGRSGLAHCVTFTSKAMSCPSGSQPKRTREAKVRKVRKGFIRGLRVWQISRAAVSGRPKGRTPWPFRWEPNLQVPPLCLCQTWRA